MNFLSDHLLYTDYRSYQSRFKWAVNESDFQSRIYHCYWGGVLSQLHDLSLKSLLVTQSPPFEVWIWIPPHDFARNQRFISSFESVPNIKFKSFTLENEAKGAGIQEYLEFAQSPGPLAISNICRLLVLGNYGGVYFDLDVLFLKDLRPLCNVEFFYQWSNQPYGNHAVCHFFKQSVNIRLLLERGLKIKNYRPAVLLRYSEILNLLKEVYVFPTFLFDPVWIANDTKIPINTYCNRFDDFFSKNIPMKLSEFFPGSYTYHWHNNWNAPINQGTIIKHIYDDVDRQFKAIFL
jgi:hypothetical protein